VPLFWGIGVKNLLVLDTSTPRAAIGVMTRAGATYSACTESGRQHGRELMPSIRTILGRARLELADIELVGVGLGPGSYTGLRVGVMAAKTIAYATGAVLVGLDTLEAIARNAAGEATRIAVIADAQRGDLYVAEWERDDPGGPLRLTRPCEIEPLLAWLGRVSPRAVILGPALESATIRASIPPHRLPTDPGSNFADARHLIQLALDADAQGLRDDLWNLEPRYLRRSSAEEKWEARQPPSG
jgi:tRNA threonylcarbamoyladenosine biosynthesis protein TsaB